MKNFEKVTEVIAKQLGKRATDIKPNHRIVEDLGADSLDMVEMLMTLEDDHGVVIPDGVAMTLKTVEQIVAYLTQVEEGGK